MKKTAISSLLCCLVFFACSKKDDDGGTVLPPKELHVKLRIEGKYLQDNEQGWVVLSGPDGTALTCQNLQNGTTLELQSPDPFFGDDYHLTLVKKSFLPSDEPGYPALEHVSLETFAFIQHDSLSLVIAEPQDIPLLYPRAYVNLHNNTGTLENFVVSSTLTAYKGDHWDNPHLVGMIREAGDVYLILKIEGEQGWRHGLFEEVPSNTTVDINTSQMELIPLSIVQVPTGYESDLGIIGIRDCAMNEFLALQWYTSDIDGFIPARYSEGIFDKFRSIVTLKKEDKAFEMIKLGGPITEYMPTPLGFNVTNQSIQDFELSLPNDFTTFEADWAHELAGTDVYRTANWKVWSAFPAKFIAPNLPDCLAAEMDWLHTSDFKLSTVKEKHHSSLNDFSSYLDYYLAHYRDPIGCGQYGFNGEGSLETKTKFFQ
ncbi:MAG: hypothetical protein IT258_12415 [Saprospiraceae bacterium]|nr:hypothetical protein [Saprospiraceae bacterium]